jgi:outer membrane receptor for ferrienterochelin and colicins
LRAAAAVAFISLMNASLAPGCDAVQQPGGTVIVGVTSQGAPVPDASVQSGSVHAITDPGGIAQLMLPAGKHALIVAKIGFASDTVHVIVTAGAVTRVQVSLRAAAEELAEVVVFATRDERRISDEPTRVEVTDRDDIEEQIAASPGGVAELLTEASGVRVQTTASGLGGSVRIRGLSGRYTELLSDGLPLVGLTTQELGPLQMPPMDLERVEVIKGVASALYGPTALGGVVNLVSQRPNNERELVINETSSNATDLVFFSGRRLGPRWGYTLLASADRQATQDPDGDGWADIPGFRRLVLRPRVFWSGSAGNSLLITTGLTAENRTGGTVNGGVVANGRPFDVGLDTRRADVGAVGRFRLHGSASLSLRSSVTEEWDTRTLGGIRERDRRTTLFSELAVNLTRASQIVVLGAAIQGDLYHARDVPAMNYNFVTPALFAQDTWLPVAWFGLMSSVRLDMHSAYGGLVSPRASALFRFNEHWSARVGAGLSTFTPTPFTDETNAIALSHLRPIAGLRVEQARSVSVDVGGKLGPVEVIGSVHGTIIERAIALRSVAGSMDSVELVNRRAPTRGGGVELFAHYAFDPVTVTASYVYLYGTQVDDSIGTRRTVPLNPRHAGGLSAVWEKEGAGTRVGLEVFYTGRQALEDDPYRTTSVPFVTVDALVQQRVGSVRLFLHGENLTNVHQTQFDPLLLPAQGLGGRWTTDIWAPLAGRVVNVGARVGL